MIEQLEGVMHRPGDEIRVLLHQLVPEYMLPRVADPDQAIAGQIGTGDAVPLKRSA